MPEPGKARPLKNDLVSEYSTANKVKPPVKEMKKFEEVTQLVRAELHQHRLSSTTSSQMQNGVRRDLDMPNATGQDVSSAQCAMTPPATVTQTFSAKSLSVASTSMPQVNTQEITKGKTPTPSLPKIQQQKTLTQTTPSVKPKSPGVENVTPSHVKSSKPSTPEPTFRGTPAPQQNNVINTQVEQTTHFPETVVFTVVGSITKVSMFFKQFAVFVVSSGNTNRFVILTPPHYTADSKNIKAKLIDHRLLAFQTHGSKVWRATLVSSSSTRSGIINLLDFVTNPRALADPEALSNVFDDVGYLITASQFMELNWSPIPGFGPQIKPLDCFYQKQMTVGFQTSSGVDVTFVVIIFKKLAVFMAWSCHFLPPELVFGERGIQCLYFKEGKAMGFRYKHLSFAARSPTKIDGILEAIDMQQHFVVPRGNMLKEMQRHVKLTSCQVRESRRMLREVKAMTTLTLADQRVFNIYHLDQFGVEETKEQIFLPNSDVELELRGFTSIVVPRSAPENRVMDAISGGKLQLEMTGDRIGIKHPSLRMELSFKYASQFVPCNECQHGHQEPKIIHDEYLATYLNNGEVKNQATLLFDANLPLIPDKYVSKVKFCPEANRGVKHFREVCTPKVEESKVPPVPPLLSPSKAERVPPLLSPSKAEQVKLTPTKRQPHRYDPKSKAIQVRRTSKTLSKSTMKRKEHRVSPYSSSKKFTTSKSTKKPRDQNDCKKGGSYPTDLDVFGSETNRNPDWFHRKPKRRRGSVDSSSPTFDECRSDRQMSSHHDEVAKLPALDFDTNDSKSSRLVYCRDCDGQTVVDDPIVHSMTLNHWDFEICDETDKMFCAECKGVVFNSQKEAWNHSVAFGHYQLEFYQ